LDSQPVFAKIQFEPHNDLNHFELVLKAKKNLYKLLITHSKTSLIAKWFHRTGLDPVALNSAQAILFSGKWGEVIDATRRTAAAF